MSAPVLARHGQNVKPVYASPGPTGASPVGQSTDAERPDGNLSGIVKRYSKRESAAPKPISLLRERAAYSHQDQRAPGVARRFDTRIAA